MTPNKQGINMCDGCQRGLPIEKGLHKGQGYDLTTCTADRYKQGTEKCKHKLKIS